MTLTEPETAAATTTPLLASSNVSCVYAQAGTFGTLSRKKGVRAVDDVTVEVFPGETLAIVGESGCGKTTLSKLLLGLLSPTSGRIEYRGEDVRKLSRDQQRAFRKSVQVIFQDPLASLNPRKQVRKILGDIVRLWGGKQSPEVINRRVQQVLREVELTPPRLFLERFPHELSGGQRQRVAIAKAIAVEPQLIVADEPLSALDVSVQGQILELLRRLQAERGVSFVLISHDLEVVRTVADRVVVMYLGKVVESGSVTEVFGRPRHPYTRSLLASVLRADPRAAQQRERALLAGEVPSMESIPAGCRFHPRCPVAAEHCKVQEPDATGTPETTHVVFCHRAHEEGVVEQIEVPTH
jgi:oligopeptide/dipeptide ABC transporter ATP-binding protein